MRGKARLMISLIANIFTHSAGGSGSPLFFFLIGLAIVAVFMLVGACQDIIGRLIKHFHGRNWPTALAVIDIVSVTFFEDNTIKFKANLDMSYYLATLTYVYQYPEQQMGDYSRRFGIKEDAEAWANSYKGETVKVHVDPRAPTRSVLREEDL
jgi:hypothetical protein